MAKRKACVFSLLEQARASVVCIICLLESNESPYNFFILRRIFVNCGLVEVSDLYIIYIFESFTSNVATIDLLSTITQAASTSTFKVRGQFQVDWNSRFLSSKLIVSSYIVNKIV